MNTFTIENETNNITIHMTAQEAEAVANAQSFSNEARLAELAAEWPAARLVEIWNSLPGVEPLERFTSRKVAVKRIWKAIQQRQPSGGAHRHPARAKKGSTKKQASRKARLAVRENSKTARVIALLRQPGGASLKVIMHATRWQAHSVRGFISGQLGKKMGLRVRSFERDGERVYAIKGLRN
jgi:hypothetical protein